MNNLTDINYLKQLFRRHNLRPKDYLGQNFLVDDSVLMKIIEAAELNKNDTVLEVGPGVGTLTVELVKHAGKVIAVEKDERIVKVLKSVIPDPGSSPGQALIRDPESEGLDSRFRGNDKIKVLNQDILRFNLEREIPGPYKVVANIPYYLTSHLIKYFLTQKNSAKGGSQPEADQPPAGAKPSGGKPELLVLMVQKEVGERIVAQPGDLSVLGISVQFYADPEIIAKVPAISFWPQPEVDSVILKILPKQKFPEVKDEKLFFSIIKQAFAGKRKQLKNTIRDLEALKKAGIDSTIRPQDLSLGQWVNIYLAIKKGEK